MKKYIHIFAALGLMLLLAACGATETTTRQSNFVTATSTVSPHDTPTPEPPMTEEIAATKEPMVQKPTVTTETMPAEETADPTEEVIETATEEMAVPEESMVEEKGEMVEQIDVPQPTAAQQQLLDSLPVIGAPPELNNEIWLNSDPLQLADLRGQVVIIEFWTFG